MYKNWSKLVLIGSTITCMVFTSACDQKSDQASLENKENQQSTIKETTTQPKLDLTFIVNPLNPRVDKEASLEATVKQSGKAVSDATVKLEIWKDGMPKHKMFDATHTKDGVYKSTSTMKDHGDYKVVVHVTTPSGLHQMTTSRFTVNKHCCCEEKK